MRLCEIWTGIACLPIKLGREGKEKKSPVVFATGGERGKTRIWRSDSGNVVAEQEATPGACIGGEIIHLESMLHNQCGLMTALADNTIALWDCKVWINSSKNIETTESFSLSDRVLI